MTYISTDPQKDNKAPDDSGLFRHYCYPPAPGDWPKVIRKPNRCTGISPNVRTVILKIHGHVEPSDHKKDSFVITEDDYIEYLSRPELEKAVPVRVLEKILDCHFLFLGYGLQDWNLRAMLYRVARGRLRRTSWAIQREPDELDSLFWGLRGVQILNVPLSDYIAGLKSCL